MPSNHIGAFSEIPSSLLLSVLCLYSPCYLENSLLNICIDSCLASFKAFFSESPFLTTQPSKNGSHPQAFLRPVLLFLLCIYSYVQLPQFSPAMSTPQASLTNNPISNPSFLCKKMWACSLAVAISLWCSVRQK